MKTFNWSWTKFIVGIAADKMPSIDLIDVWVVAIHLGPITIIIAPN